MDGVSSEKVLLCRELSPTAQVGSALARVLSFVLICSRCLGDPSLTTQSKETPEDTLTAHFLPAEALSWAGELP